MHRNSVGKWLQHARDFAQFMGIPEDDDIMTYPIDEKGAKEIVQELVDYQLEMGNDDLETVKYYIKELEEDE